jgi:hypothetical protein
MHLFLDHEQGIMPVHLLWDYPSCIPAQKWHMNPLPLLIVWFGL